jgi:hypothetical protein
MKKKCRKRYLNYFHGGREVEALLDFVAFGAG